MSVFVSSIRLELSHGATIIIERSDIDEETYFIKRTFVIGNLLFHRKKEISEEFLNILINHIFSNS